MNTNIKFNKKAMIIPLMVLASTSAYAGPNGHAAQKACIKLAQATYENISVDIHQNIADSGPVASTNETLSLPAGSTGEICGNNIVSGDIWANGSVDVSWKITNSSGDIIKSFSTSSTFNGQGANNDWDINEKGQCAANGQSQNGVYLTANGKESCGPLEDISDDAVVKATYAVDLGDNPVPDYGYTHYNSEQVKNGTQTWSVAQHAYSERTQLLYTCNVANWCNGDPTYYEPGHGLTWSQAWTEYTPEKS